MAAGTATVAAQSALTFGEADELAACESRIERGLSTFSDVGMALATIRDNRLYRATHDTFEDYCQERWGMQRNYANKVIAAAGVVENLGTMVPILPATETQARPLTNLAPDVQREVWSRAVETAQEGRITAKHVEQVVMEWKSNRLQHDDPGLKPQQLVSKVANEVADDGDVPSTVTLRVARVVYLMAMGKHMSLAEIAEKTGLTENGAWRLMNRLVGGHHVPVTIDEDEQWCIMEKRGANWDY